MNLESIEILQRLIAFQSVSASSNLDLIHWIANYLDSYGVVPRLSYNEDRSKANLFATLGADAGCGLLLSGHSDVVPAKDQHWTHEPFEAELSDGRIYGRGSCDMKGFIAAVLALAPDFLASAPEAPVHLAFTFDEEIGCQGVRTLLIDLESAGLRPRACLVGEPTELRVVTAHKGAGMYACEIQGAEVHSSLAPKAVNAIHAAAKVIAHIDALGSALVQREVSDPLFDIPNSTLQVNQMQGGTAGNIVAGRCRFTIDVRHLPSTDRESLVAEIQSFIDREVLPALLERAPEGYARISTLAEIPAFSIDDSSPFVGRVRHALRSDGCCLRTAFATEAGFFQKYGIPTVICGPGSIEQAHRPDEFLAIEQLTACGKMLGRLMRLPA